MAPSSIADIKFLLKTTIFVLRSMYWIQHYENVLTCKKEFHRIYSKKTYVHGYSSKYPGGVIYVGGGGGLYDVYTQVLNRYVCLRSSHRMLTLVYYDWEWYAYWLCLLFLNVMLQ